MFFWQPEFYYVIILLDMNISMRQKRIISLISIAATIDCILHPHILFIQVAKKLQYHLCAKIDKPKNETMYKNKQKLLFVI